jgi:hypothetical protein
VERSFAWVSRFRRLAKDYERRVQTSETLIEVAMIRLLLARLGQRAERHANRAVRNGRESAAYPVAAISHDASPHDVSGAWRLLPPSSELAGWATKS